MTKIISRLKEEFEFKNRLQYFLLLGIGVGFLLAVAYTYGGGIELVDNPQGGVIDSYAFNISLLIGSLIPLGYLMAFRDISEALAIELGILYSLYSGLEDIFVYLLLPDTSVPAKLPWLNDSTVAILPNLVGVEMVTGPVLYANVIVTGIFVLVLVKILDDLEAEFLGVPF